MLRPDELQHFHAGDESFFRALHERFAPRLRADISPYVPRPDDIDDVLQNAWTRIFEQRTSFANRGSFEAWLRRICRSICSDWLRAERKRRALADQLRQTEEFESVEIGVQDGLQRDVDLQQLYELVENELKRLPDRQFEIAIYRWLLGYSTKQSATCAHVAIGTVKAALHQARQKIRAQLPAQSMEGNDSELDGSLRPQQLHK